MVVTIHKYDYILEGVMPSNLNQFGSVTDKYCLKINVIGSDYYENLAK